MIAEGATADVVREYLSASWGMTAEKIFESDAQMPSSDAVRLKKVRIIDIDGETCGTFDIRKKVGIEATYEVLSGEQILLPNFQVYNQDRTHIFTIQDVSGEWMRQQKKKGEFVSTAWIPGNLMSEGSFFVNVAIVTYLPKMTVHFNALEAVSFSVIDPMTGDTARGDFVGNMDGAVRPLVEWETAKK
jgi:lipopolysaccharide transport system ATP-binding protein